MKRTTALNGLGICLLAGTIAAATMVPSRFEARTSGARVVMLSGAAEFGNVPTRWDRGSFVLTLGASSESGAVVFTSRHGARPAPGVYQVGGDSDEITALVVIGSPSHPTGAYRAQAGTLTVRQSSDRYMTGEFSLETRGYEVADPGNEDRPLTVQGSFSATATR